MKRGQLVEFYYSRHYSVVSPDETRSAGSRWVSAGDIGMVIEVPSSKGNSAKILTGEQIIFVSVKHFGIYVEDGLKKFFIRSET